MTYVLDITPGQAIEHVNFQWNLIFPKERLPHYYVARLLTKFHPIIVEKKLSDIARNADHVVFPIPYLQQTFQDSNVLVFQEAEKLAPMFELDDDGENLRKIAPPETKSVLERKVVRSMGQRRVVFLVNQYRDKAGKEPLSERRIGGEVRKLYREHQARVVKREIKLPGAIAHTLINRLVAE